MDTPPSISVPILSSTNCQKLSKVNYIFNKIECSDANMRSIIAPIGLRNVTNGLQKYFENAGALLLLTDLVPSKQK